MIRVTAICDQCGKKIDLSDDQAKFVVVHLGDGIGGQKASYPELRFHFPDCIARYLTDYKRLEAIAGFVEKNYATKGEK